MTWNYRRIALDDGSIGIYEVYYDKQDKPELRTTDPVSLYSFDGPEDLEQDLNYIRLSALGQPILTEKDFK